MKRDNSEQRQKVIIKSTGFESNELEQVNLRGNKEERGTQEELKQKAPMFYIAEEHETRIRKKSLKKK